MPLVFFVKGGVQEDLYDNNLHNIDCVLLKGNSVSLMETRYLPDGIESKLFRPF